MKKFITFIILLFIVNISFADTFKIPQECYPKEIQKLFRKKGYKLEVTSEKRSKDSWGFLRNEGNEFSICTYKSVTEKELKDMLEIMNEYNSK